MNKLILDTIKYYKELSEKNGLNLKAIKINGIIYIK